MTETLSDIAAHIDNVRQLDSVVTAMRGIAAARSQHSRNLVSSIDSYSDVISQAIGQALRFVPSQSTGTTKRKARSAQLLMGAEHGFAGPLSRHVLEQARSESSESIIFLAGTRLRVIAAERNVPIAWDTPMATQASGVAAVAMRIIDALFSRIIDQEIERVEILHPFVQEDHFITVRRTHLLPLDLESFRRPRGEILPLTTLNHEMLLQRLTAEYIYARIFEATMHTFAAENQARMEVMTSASSNIDHTLEELQRKENQVRQEEITAEIVELSAGTFDQFR